MLIDDEVEVSLSVASLLVLEAKVKVWEHVETGREEGDCLGHYTQLPLLGLGCRIQHTNTHRTLYVYNLACVA